MTNHRNTFSAWGAIALVLLLAAPMHGAGPFNRTDTITFSGPVRLPGVTLGAGSYIFERIEPTNHDIIVVRSADRTRHYFMGWTNRVERPAHLGSGSFATLGETRPGTPPP